MSARSPALRLTRQARRDFDDILLATARTWGQDQADTYEETIDRAFQDLRAHQLQGRTRDDLAASCRSRVVDRHVIFYVYAEAESSIVVLRILHQRQDAVRHVKPPRP